jgi:hypothetical protein
MRVTEYVASNPTNVALPTNISRVASWPIRAIRRVCEMGRGIPPAATEGTSLSGMNRPPADSPLN